MLLSHRNRWLLVIGGLLFLMLVFNVLLLTFALRNGEHPIPQAYERALKWDEERASLEALRQVGWQLEAQALPSSSGGHTVRVQLEDAAHQMLTDVAVRATLVRIDSHEGPRPPFALASSSPGVYEATVPSLSEGFWQLELELVKGSLSFQTSVRVWVPAGAATGQGHGL